MALTRLRRALPWLLCAVFAAAIATAPHWLTWLRSGSGAWFADTDELGLYLQVASHAWFSHPFFLADPLVAGAKPTFYPAAQIVPGILAAKGLGLGPVWIGPMLRLLGAVAVATGWYLLFGAYLGNAWLACAASIYAMADAGLLEGKIFFKQLVTLARAGFSGESPLLANKPDLMPQWRIINPLDSYPFLLFFLWAMARARKNPRRGAVALAGILLGLLVYAYFYFWTAAFLGLAIAMLIDREGRKAYFHAGWIGALVGFPHVLGEYLLKSSRSDEWLHRSDKFVHIGHFSELLIPKIGPALLLLLSAWLWRKRKDIRFLVANALAGLLLLNHQIVTGLQIENPHWNYYWSLALTVIFAVAAVEGTRRLIAARPGVARGLAVAAAACVALQAAAGMELRLRETDAALSRGLVAQYRAYLSQRFAQGAPRLERGTVVGGDASFVLFGAFLEDQRPLVSYSASTSPQILDAELYERDALNAYLLGYEPTGLERDIAPLMEVGMGLRLRDPAVERATERRLLETFENVSAQPKDSVRRFDVRYVALDPASPTLASAERHLGALGWKVLETGPRWRVWARVPSAL